MLFGLIWTSLVLVFSGLVGYATANQLRAEFFSTTTGVITHSELTYHSASHGSPTTGVDIRYTYQVGGATHEATRYRYDEGSSSDSEWARQAVDRYSVGSEVPVFYDPKNPSESVLVPGLDGGSYMLLIFITPFDMVMFGFWIAGADAVRKKFSKSKNGRVKVIQDGPLLRIRLPRFPPFLIPLGVIGLIAFAEIFLLGFTGGFHPKTGLAQSALVIAYGSGIAIGLWQRQKIRSGSADLIIDESAGTVELPATFGRKQRRKFALSEIHGLTAEKIIHTGSKGTSYTYDPTIRVAGLKLEDGKLADMLNQADAEDFVTWLRPHLNISTESEHKSMSMPVSKTKEQRSQS
jgi:uncharacterized protein DUF3592